MRKLCAVAACADARAADLPLGYGARRDARVTTADVDVAKARADLAEAVWRARQGLRSAQAHLADARVVAIAAKDLLNQRLALEAALQQRVVAGGESGHQHLWRGR
ncbi:MAG: hypothetical protein ACTHLA_15075 [Asticcacaulis sp.]|uniref:hypothetical protein n=1 Tax=Asticcacaulis sp. TaxID=1872648 RepID=UPI003F7C10DB